MFEMLQASKEISCIIVEKEVPDLKHRSNPSVCRVCIHAPTPQFVSSVREMFAQFVRGCGGSKVIPTTAGFIVFSFCLGD
jgi:hypothetical protein